MKSVICAIVILAFLVVELPCQSQPVKHLKVGLALGGGGTRGAAHVGVLRVLEQEKIPIDLIAGTSMGSVVGGLYSAGVSVNDIEEKFTKGSLMKSFMTVPLSVRIAIVPIFYICRKLGYRPYEGLYRGGKFRKYLNTSVPEAEQKIENLRIPFGATTLNLLDGQVYLIRKGNLGEALQASSAIPVLRRPVLWDEKLLVDGGVIANLPVSQAKTMGADIIIAVDVDEYFEPVPADLFRRIGTVAHRVMTLHLAQIDAPELRQADIAIHPNLNGISLISTKTNDAKLAIAAGEKAARSAIPAIKELLGRNGFTDFDKQPLGCR